MDSAASASSKLFGRHHLAHHALPLSAHPVEVVDIIAVEHRRSTFAHRM